MAYSTSNPPVLQSSAIGSAPKRIWSYTSTDPTATVDGAGYFTNGYALGIRQGDLLILHDTTTGIVSSLTCLAATAGSTTVDFGAGTTIGSTTNAD